MSYKYDHCEFTSITIPKNVKSIGINPFSGCSSLSEINVESGNPIYDSRDNCNAIIETKTNALLAGCKNTIIPNSVTSIGAQAFYNIHLSSVILSENIMSISSHAFTFCLIFCNNETPPTAKENAFDECVSIVPQNAVEKYEEAEGWKKTLINSPFLSCKVTQSTATLTTSSLFTQTVAFIGETAYTPQNDVIKITGLSPNTSYTIMTKGRYGAIDLEQTFEVKTLDVTMDIKLIEATNVTMTLEGIKALGDITVKEYGFEGYEGMDNIQVDGLVPGKEYSYTFYAVSADGERFSATKKFSTEPISVTAEAIVNTSSCHLTGSYSVIDATIVDYGFNEYPKLTSVDINGLEPNTQYSKTFYVVTKEGGRVSKDVTFTTFGLTLITSQPKVITPGNVIVAAESNLDDEETNVGFEWRRTDWTEDFASNSGVAYLFEGTMEGYIRNLYTEKLWKYRPYYESNSGTRYYGDWVGIDPTNTSYFEPTIHTYSTITISNDTAYIKGYALPGTDKTKVQGFKYWKTSQGSNASHQAPSVPSNAKTVEATGQQIITATLTALDYSSTYHYVAFVTTEEGTTYYGEERVFTTPKGHSIVKDDVNEDGVVDTQDVLAIYKYMQQSDGATAPGKYDVNGDGIVDTQDVLEIYKYIQEH